MLSKPNWEKNKTKRFKGARILSVNGKTSHSKEDCVALLKKNSKGAEIEFVFGETPKEPKIPKQKKAKAGGGVPLSVFVPRGPAGYGCVLDETNGKVTLKRVKADSPFHDVLGSKVEGIQILQIEGQPVNSKAQCIDILKASDKGVRLDLLVPSQARKAQKAITASVRKLSIPRGPAGFGLKFGRKGTKFIINHVKEDSEAAAIGVVAGMEIVTIGGLEVATMPKSELTSTIQAAKDKLDIGVVGPDANVGFTAAQPQLAPSPSNHQPPKMEKQSSKKGKSKSKANPSASPARGKQEQFDEPQQSQTPSATTKPKRNKNRERPSVAANEPRYATVDQISGSNKATSTSSSSSSSSKTPTPKPAGAPKISLSKTESPKWLSNCSRKDAENLLIGTGKIGSALGRTSANATSGVVLSMLVTATNVRHFQINKSDTGEFFLHSGTTEKNRTFDSMEALVKHYCTKENKLGDTKMTMMDVPKQYRV